MLSLIFLFPVLQCCLQGDYGFALSQDNGGTGTGTGAVEPIPDPPPAYLKITNQSQWALHHLFIYRKNELYQEAENLLKTNLAPGDFLEFCLPPDDYNITVTRLKNQDGPLLAFSFSSPQTMLDYSRHDLDFLENEFRIEEKRAGMADDYEWVSEYYDLVEAYVPGTEVIPRDKIAGCITYYTADAKELLINEPCACP